MRVGQDEGIARGKRRPQTVRRRLRVDSWASCIRLARTQQVREAISIIFAQHCTTAWILRPLAGEDWMKSISTAKPSELP